MRIKGCVEPLPEIAAGSVLGAVRAEIRRHVFPLPGGHVDLDKAATAATRAVADTVDNIRVERIGRDRAGLGRWQRGPIGHVDLTEVTAAAGHHSACILLRPQRPVRVPRVGGDVIDLRDGLGIPNAPGLAAIERDVRTLIRARQNALAVGGIDPHDVIVLAAGRAFEGAERLAAIDGAVHRRAHRVQDVGVLRIHPDAAAIVALAVADAGVVAGHVLPRGAAIIGAVQPGAALQVAADYVEALAVGVHGNGNADAARVGRQRGDLGPGLAFVGRFEHFRRHGRGGAAAPTTACAPGALRGDEHHVRHVEGIFYIARAVHAFGL